MALKSNDQHNPNDQIISTQPGSNAHMWKLRPLILFTIPPNHGSWNQITQTTPNNFKGLAFLGLGTKDFFV